ncbi:hypothetical protein SAMN00790413_06249 [Deinococcus hopiensis KR-140]|uniref:Uncharacterized protein n=1 Tax=Deinococcus hopiensis KR-140 TaxID=695939 RepID=A0A1W1VUB8_9DEIO|nr:hypothetical protein SAMN00790413_06249 [Deinococcus hopiensis KR-140]
MVAIGSVFVAGQVLVALALLMAGAWYLRETRRSIRSGTGAAQWPVSEAVIELHELKQPVHQGIRWEATNPVLNHGYHRLEYITGVIWPPGAPAHMQRRAVVPLPGMHLIRINSLRIDVYDSHQVQRLNAQGIIEAERLYPLGTIVRIQHSPTGPAGPSSHGTELAYIEGSVLPDQVNYGCGCLMIGTGLLLLSPAFLILVNAVLN